MKIGRGSPCGCPGRAKPGRPQGIAPTKVYFHRSRTERGHSYDDENVIPTAGRNLLKVDGAFNGGGISRSCVARNDMKHLISRECD